MKSIETYAGEAAISQALSHKFGLSIEQVVKILNADPRTVFNYLHPRRRSTVTMWEDRTESQKNAAIDKAKKIMEK